MAGESPEKSVDAGAPGAAESSAERDPRLSVFRPRDPEDGSESGPESEADSGTRDEDGADAEAASGAGAEAGAESAERDPLREAVAAWVATTEAEAGADPEPEPEPEPEAASGEEPDDAPRSEAPGSEEPAAEEPGEPAAAEDSAAPADPEPTAAPAAAGSASADEAKPADSERTAVFRAVKPSATPPSAGSASADDAKPADSERTAVFRAVKPGTTPAAPAAQEPADSERTAVFRAVKADAVAEKPADKPAQDSASADEAEPGDSERTAVFRAVKPNSAPAATGSASADEAEPGDSERTAVFRAVKPAGAPPKASTFVPLRTDDVPAKPDAGQKPKTAPTGPGVHPADRKPAAPAPAAKPSAAPAPKPAPAPAPAPKPAPATAPKPAAAPAPAPAPAPRSVFDSAERTTQQPLPPKPPLDMLADLTNNPPPPPSPMRTAVRRVKIYAPLVVLLAVILAVVQLVRPLPEPKLVMTAQSSYTFAGAKPELAWPTEGQAYMAAAGLGTLGQSGEQKPVPIASVTKSMTAYIILRDHPIKKGEQGAMIDIDKTAETEGKKNDSVNNESTLDTVKEGDKISEYDAIAALMIPSANNIARLLARWDSGSQEAFVKKMNDTAKELGMKNTTYTDPSGLDATTVSTAEDQVKLGLKLVEMETLLDITKKPKWTDPWGKEWRNWNGLVPANDSLGIKTGTTTKAGGNLLFAAQKKIGNTNQLIVGAVLGQHKPPIIDSVVAASKQLMISTQKALEGAPVVKKGAVVGYVDDGLGGRTPVVATADVQAVGWAALTVDVKLTDGGSKIPQTAKAGTEIGLLTVGEGASQVKVPVALKSDLAAPGIGSKLTRVG
ncbi:hypothetical protein AB0D94_35665 [Streptomyces sp. NPDC048255]|uniref:hypothetical protein n=1 Tax=Streptomyces sp. NPDC048255 TaxID=3154713 RepID=UPI0033E17B6D